jgi:hypothetical protein
VLRGRSKVLIAIAGLLVFAVVLRAVSPAIVERYVNRQLGAMGDYQGHVVDVDLMLLRGGYTLHDLTIVKTNANVETPFVAVPQMDLTLGWRALFHGQAVGELVMYAPNVNFVQSRSDQESQYGTGVNWPQEIRDLFPFRLNVVRVVDGLATFRAPGIQAEESMTARDFQLELTNLTNVQEVESEAHATIDLNARVMGNAPLTLNGQIDPNEELPTFDVDLTLEGARLVDINPWLREFLKADAHAGTFSLYAELAAADGRFTGYIKPILENPEFVERDDADEGPFRKAWEALVGFAAKVFENKTEDQVATQIPFSGEFEDPRAGILPALVNLMRNAFVSAFARTLDNTISFRDVGEDVSCLENGDHRSDECEQRESREEPVERERRNDSEDRRDR